LPKFKYHKEHLCPSCEQGKSKRASHPPKPVPNSRQRLHLLHMDLCRPMRIASINGKWYILVKQIWQATEKLFTNVGFQWQPTERKFNLEEQYSLTRFTESKLVPVKQPKSISTSDIVTTERLSNTSQKPLTSSEDSTVEWHCRKTEPYSCGGFKTMLIFSKAMMFLWAEAVATACYTQNRSLIHTRHNKNLYELVHDKKTDLKFLCVFGALCYPKNDSEDLGNLRPTADIRFFVGYAPNKKGYRIYNKKLDVQFDELTDLMAPVHISIGPEPILLTPGQISVERSFPLASVVQALVVSAGTPSSTKIDQDAPSTSYSPSSSIVQPPISHQGVTAGPTIKDSPFAQADNDPCVNVFALKPSSDESLYGDANSAESTQICLYNSVLSKVKPKNVKTAMDEACWFDTMQEEIHKFDRLQVWELVPKPYCVMIIALKWIYKVKLDEYSDVLETRHEAIRIFIANATSKNMIIYQMNVKTAFLNGELKEEVYAPRVWNNTLSRFLLDNKFSKGVVDPTLFTRKTGKHVLLVQIYVDDIIFASIDPNACDIFSIEMSSKFQMSMMGQMSSFLGLQHSRSKHIDIHHHFIREKVKNDVVDLYFVTMDYQLADIFTKAFPRDRFEFPLSRLGMKIIFDCNPLFNLRNACRQKDSDLVIAVWFNLGIATKKDKSTKPHAIPYRWSTKLLIYYLGNINQRSGSPFNMAEDDHHLGNLKKAPYYNAYLEIGAKHDQKIASEEGGKKKSVSKFVQSKKPTTSKQPKLVSSKQSKHTLAKQAKPVKEKSTPVKIAAKGKTPGQAPVGGVAFREPASGITLKLPIVEGKGKGIATNEQVAQSLLELQTPKKTNTTDQYIFQRRIPVTEEAYTGPSAQPEDDTSANIVREDVADKVDLEEKIAEIDKGQARSDLGKTPESQPRPKRVLLEEDQARPNPRQSHVTLAGPDPEPMHDDFFFNDKPTEDDLGKTTMETKVESMVTVLIHQVSSSVHPLSTPVIDLTPLKPISPTIQELFFTETTKKTTTTLPLPPPPQQQSSTDPALAFCVSALEQVRANFEKRHKLQDKTVQEHVALYEALEAFMDRDNRDGFLAEKDKSRKRCSNDQDPPPPLPDSNKGKKKRNHSDASTSHQQKDCLSIWTTCKDVLIPDDVHFLDTEIRKSKLSKADSEGPGYKIDLVNPEGQRVVPDVSKLLLLGGPPGLKNSYYYCGLKVNKNTILVQPMKMMRETEVHKFSDGTLTKILEKLDHMVKDFKLFKYNLGMETRIWSQDDKRMSKEFINVIERRLKIRRISRSLESFVSGRLRDVDYRLI
nr:hypothetical protein [Tanacetum cinerariifolium]